MRHILLFYYDDVVTLPLSFSQASKHMLVNSQTGTSSLALHAQPPPSIHPHPLSFSSRTSTYQEHIQAHRPIKSVPPTPSPPQWKCKNQSSHSPFSLRSHSSDCSSTKVAGSYILSHTLCCWSRANASHLDTGRWSRQTFVNNLVQLVSLPRKPHQLL